MRTSTRLRIVGAALALTLIPAVAAAARLPVPPPRQRPAPPRRDRAATTAQSQRIDDGSRFYVPQLQHYQDALRQVAQLTSSGDHEMAAALRTMIQTPQAVWVTESDPKKAEQQVRQVVSRAAGKQEVPVLVAYNIPFRDCAQYSAGGATTTAEYEAWVDGFARGIGKSKAVVILEPDGLGIIPWYDPFADRDGSSALEWCQPAEADPATAATDRFDQLNQAVDRIGQQPRAKVYLDGTHSAWLGSGDAADRLVKAGVFDAAGFFINVSNFQEDQRLIKHATWTSQCIAFANNADEGGWRLGHYEWCASQYFPANPSDFSTWHLSDEWYAANLGTATRADDPFRHRQQPERAGAVDPTGRSSGRRPAGLVQPSRSWHGHPPDRQPGSRSSTPTCGSRSRVSPTAPARVA